MVKPVPTQTVVSDTPFIPPPARLTGPVDAPAEGEVGLAQDKTVSVKDPKDAKEKKKPRKSRKESRDKDRVSKKRQVSPSPEARSTNRPEVKPTPVHPKPPVHQFSLNLCRCTQLLLILLHKIIFNPVLPVKRFFIPALPVGIYLLLLCLMTLL